MANGRQRSPTQSIGQENWGQEDSGGPNFLPNGYAMCIASLADCYGSAFRITGTSSSTLFPSTASCSICVLMPAVAGVTDTVKT